MAHLVGAAEASASPRESMHQVRAGKKLHPGGPVVDGMNALQVRERASHTPARLLTDLAEASVRAVAARRKIPITVRAIPVPWGPPLGVRSVGYLMDRIYTRDAWMHRIDISRATDASLATTAAHDGRIVGDIVHEWAAKHRRPFQLELTGTAGGRWSSGIGGEQICLEAIEFARVLSGRGKATGLLTIGVPF
ncbi:maleylpyruvate isomerase N-terminal domain-containing protein [Arthrobacter sp. 2MCAF14]|uniref:maleylpyruvate isomerase N-terminal domain-containing protein n=1 Tax=Arthrobacter sp. 2MCAF14 TaxID=3232982 RepID=UPI003F924BB1